MNTSGLLNKAGIVGAALAALCCLGISAAVSLVTTVGLGFLINDRVLAPLMIAFLALAIAGLALDSRHHRRRAALTLGVLGGVGLILFSFIAPSRIGAVAAIAALVAASSWNIYFRRHPA